VVDVLVIPDGAAQPVLDGRATALETAATPVLDQLAAEGAVFRVATTPEGLPAGSETGIPALLGATPHRIVGRGWVDAAAHGIEVADGLIPWRADLIYRSGRRASIRQVRDARAHLKERAFAIGGHRLVVLAGYRPRDRSILGLRLRFWPEGSPPEGSVPRPTALICAWGAAAGCGRLLGANVVVPSGATGDVDSDLRAKAAAASAAFEDFSRVVVHVGGPDEAAHRRDPVAVIEVLERMDAELLHPLRDSVEAVGGRLAVCPDHGTDPRTSLHDASPVPAVVWGAGVERQGPSSFTERAALAAPVLAADTLFPEVLETA
jgi:2,3-bisphosphoglycerate-independent phosphoglycerate mutase